MADTRDPSTDGEGELAGGMQTALRRIEGVVVAVGILLRVCRWLANAPLWGDEVLLQHNVATRSFVELLRPLEAAQGAPPLFLWLQKLAFLIGGADERAARFWPLLASVASLLLFVRVARVLLPDAARVLALALFALAESQLCFAAQAKHYSMDVLAALLLVDRALRVRAAPAATARWIELAAIGVLAVLASFCAGIVAAAVLLALVIDRSIDARRDERWRRVGRAALVAMVWAVPLAWIAFTLLRPLRGDPYIATFWKRGFLPASPFSFVYVRALGERLAGFFHDPAALDPAGSIQRVAFAFLAGVGAVAAARRSLATFALLLAPFLITIAAAMAHAFPFATAAGGDVLAGDRPWIGRLSLFLTPFASLVLAHGLAAIPRFGRRRASAVALVASFVFIAPFVPGAARKLAKPPVIQDARSVVNSIPSRARAGDRVFVPTSSVPLYRWYAERRGDLPPFESLDMLTSPALPALRERVSKLATGERFWVFATFAPDDIADAVMIKIEGILDRIAFRLDRIDGVRVRAWLFRVDAAATEKERPR